MTRRINVGVVPRESEEQKALFRWLELVRVPVPRATDIGRDDWISLSEIAFAVPNGAVLAGDTRQRARHMANLKAQGFRNGVADVVVPIPTVRYHGLFIELKRLKGSKTSDAQIDFAALMRRLDYRVEICKGWEAARDVVVNYLAGMHRIETPIAVPPPRATGFVV